MGGLKKKKPKAPKPQMVLSPDTATLDRAKRRRMAGAIGGNTIMSDALGG